MALSFSNVLSNSSAAQNALNTKLSPQPLSTASLANAKAKGIGPSTISLAPTAKPAATPAPVAPKVASAAPVTSVGNPAATASTYTAPPPTSSSTTVTQPPQSSTPSSAAMPPSTTPPVSYSGLVGNLVQNAQNTATQGQMTPEETAARARLAGIPGLIGSTNANIENHPSDLSFQMGREAVAGRNIEAMRQSEAEQVSAYAAERGANTGAYSAAGSQLGGAISASAPSVTGYGQTSFNPLTGSFGNGNVGVSPSDPFYQTLQTYAQQLATNQGASIPSSITGNPALQAQLIQMAKAINPSFNSNVAAGAGAAQASNAQLSGTATPQAYAGIYNQALSDYTNLQQSVSNVDSFGNLLTSNMQSGGINPSDVKYANKTLAQIRGSLSSGAQAQYDTTLAALRSKISGMLSIGGNETPTAITADAQKILDGTLPFNQLGQVLGRIQQEGQVLLTNQADKVNKAKAGTMGPGATQPSSSSGGGSSGGTVQAGGYSFVQDASGKWVPASTA